MYYWGQNRIDAVAALKDLITALGGNPFALTFLLSKQQLPAKKPYKDILREYNIQIGFSDFVQQTVQFLSIPGTSAQNDQSVQEVIKEIKSVNV